jgi:hypothetical protein
MALQVWVSLVYIVYSSPYISQQRRWAAGWMKMGYWLDVWSIDSIRWATYVSSGYPCCWTRPIYPLAEKTAEPQWEGIEKKEEEKTINLYNVRPIYFEDRAIPVPLFHESYTGDSRHTVMSAVIFLSMHNVERPTVCRGQKGMLYRSSRNEFCAPLGNGFCFFLFKYPLSHAFKGVWNLHKNVRLAPNIFFTYSRSLCILYNDFDRLMDLFDY